MLAEEPQENYGAGWIKLHRSVMNKAWYKKPEYNALWNHLILKATHRQFDAWFDGKSIKLEAGQFITGRKKLAEETGIHESKVERILTYFENIEKQIVQKKNTVSRLISIVNYSSYQSNENQSYVLHRTDNMQSIEPKIEQPFEQPSTEEKPHNSEQPFEQPVNNERTTSEQPVNTKQEHNNIRTKEKKRETAPPEFIMTDEQKIEWGRFEKFIADETPNVQKMKVKLTPRHYFKIVKKFDRELGGIRLAKEELADIMRSMQNKATLLKDFNDANLTIQSWFNLRKKKGNLATNLAAKKNTNPSIVLPARGGYTGNNENNEY